MSQTMEDTAGRIVDAAETLLGEVGLAKTTLDLVAEAAGLHRATIYRHFPGGRDELLVAVMERRSRRLVDRLMTHVAAEPTFAEALVEGIVFTADETLRSPTIAPLFTAGQTSRASAAAPASRVLRSIVREAWQPLLQQAKARGEAREDVDIEVLSELLLRLLFSLMSDWQNTPRSREETKEFLRAVLTPYVAAGATPRARTAENLGPSVIRTRVEVKDSSMNDVAVADRLLESAARLFREKGYERSSTRELAERLGVRQPSLYYHVNSKQDLLERLCVTSLRRLSATAQAVADDPDATIWDLIVSHVRSLAEDRDLHLARIFEEDALVGPARARVATEHDAYAALVRRIIETQQGLGRLRADIDAGKLAMALLNLLNWTVFWVDPNGPASPGEAADVLAEVFVHGAGAGRAEQDASRVRGGQRSARH
jgi:AcrR family transcriptional regulator